MSRLFKKIFIFLSVLGPSVITTMAGNDGAGVITYSFAGARLGYAALFALPLLTVLYAITQEMGSRAAIVTDKGLGDIIRKRFGVKVALVSFLALIIANFGTMLTNVAALRTASEMLGISTVPFMIVTVIFCFVIVTFTKYEKSQKVFLTGIIFYMAYVLSAILSRPDWGEAVKATFIPQEIMRSKDYLLFAIAVIGTTITPWGQFFVQSYMKDKGVPLQKIGYAKLEAYLGAIIAHLITSFIMIATAATLFVNKIPFDSGEKAAMAIRPFVGEFAGTLFAIGLVNAAIIGIIIIGLTSAYAFTEFFGFTGSLDEDFKKSKSFYILFLSKIVLAVTLVLTPFFPLFKIVLYSQSLNGILLPFFFYFLLKILNDRNIMGEHVNKKWENYYTIIFSVFITLAGLTSIVIAFRGLN